LNLKISTCRVPHVRDSIVANVGSILPKASEARRAKQLIIAFAFAVEFYFSRFQPKKRMSSP
jgi:hypothetical protein